MPPYKLQAPFKSIIQIQRKTTKYMTRQHTDTLGKLEVGYKQQETDFCLRVELVIGRLAEHQMSHTNSS